MRYGGCLRRWPPKRTLEARDDREISSEASTQG
jgi:hypothetical protein